MNHSTALTSSPRLGIKSVLTLLAALALTLTAFAARADQVTNYAPDGVAIGGTDPVAYFTMSKPVPGKAEYSAQHNGVTWKFSSAENKAKFIANPAKYAPQYGGYCATGASFGHKVATTPNHWKIVEGKLYLNSSDGAHNRFLGDMASTISNADTNWPKIKSN